MTSVRPLCVLIKGLLMFTAVNAAYAFIDPSLTISAYNSIFPGRIRLPFGGQVAPYSVMVDDIDIMLGSHALSSGKPASEFRVVLIGDSSVWQEDVPTPDTFSEQWNNQGLECKGRQVKFYNLGYPHPSVVKDLVIMDEAMSADPDLIIWFITTNTIMPRRVNPFITANREKTLEILDTYGLPLTGEDELRSDTENWFEKTLFGKRSLLARWIKLQTLGLIWSATSLDYHDDRTQDDPLPANDLPDSLTYMGMETQTDFSDRLLFDAIRAGHDIAGGMPVLLVNEPIFIADGKNSDIRYNDTYPRWAYDQYRSSLLDEASENGWDYSDLWDIVPPEYFSTTLHVTKEGGRVMIDALTPIILEYDCQ